MIARASEARGIVWVDSAPAEGISDAGGSGGLPEALRTDAVRVVDATGQRCLASPRLTASSVDQWRGAAWIADSSSRRSDWAP
jgi:hypothetical protein